MFTYRSENTTGHRSRPITPSPSSLPSPTPPPVSPEKQVRPPEWIRQLNRYEQPNTKKAVWQLLNTVLPYGILWGALIAAFKSGVPYWATLPLILIAAGLLVRTFIIFHDCCHGSFLPSRRANKILGYITGVLTFTPFDEWQHEHAVHHATSGDLNRRGVGDIWTMTVDEYAAADWKTRAGYRIFRHPLALFILGPGVMFMFLQRIPHRNAGPRGRSSVALTNLGIVALLAVASVLVGFKTVVLIQVPIMAIAAGVGAWLFYVQHQYEGVYWARREHWDPVAAALDGSSYYELPKLLQWFSGNIGFHHIHHLRPRIPNYNLEECFNAIPALQKVRRLTLLGSIRCSRLHLWDEGQQRLVGWSGA